MHCIPGCIQSQLSEASIDISRCLGLRRIAYHPHTQSLHALSLSRIAMANLSRGSARDF